MKKISILFLKLAGWVLIGLGVYWLLQNHVIDNVPSWLATVISVLYLIVFMVIIAPIARKFYENIQ
ncbi:hypothetical protein QQM79_20950 [Marinobacteraceae bacterium S3BR75-40.1]